MPSRIIGQAHLEIAERAPGSTSRAPILCLHGLFAAGWVFDRVLPLAAARGHVTGALSFRGHAPAPPSDRLGSLSLDDYLADARDAAAALGRPVVIGHSLGGLVAQTLAREGLVRAAVLVSPAPPRHISVLSPPLLARMARYLPDLLLSRAFKPRDEDLDALVLNRVPTHERAAMRSRLVPDSGRAAREAALGAQAVPRESVTVPVLVVAGDQDRFIPIGVSRRVAARYGAAIRVAPGHGHFLFAEPGWESHVSALLDWIDALETHAQ